MPVSRRARPSSEPAGPPVAAVPPGAEDAGAAAVVPDGGIVAPDHEVGGSRDEGDLDGVLGGRSGGAFLDAVRLVSRAPASTFRAESRV